MLEQVLEGDLQVEEPDSEAEPRSYNLTIAGARAVSVTAEDRDKEGAGKVT